MKVSNDVLILWQAAHGKLDNFGLMQRFLSTDNARRIGRYPKPWIKMAFSHTKKLEIALSILRWRSAIQFGPEQNPASSRMHEANKSQTNTKAPAIFPSVGSRSERPELDVVGESFYRENFDFLRRAYSAKFMSRWDAKLELARDPGNAFSKSGRAVKVLLDTLTVGYVPEILAPAIYSIIEDLSHRTLVEGSIWFDSSKFRNPKNSVKVYTAGPFEASLSSRSPTVSVAQASGISQAEQDAATWAAKHPHSRPLEPVRHDGANSFIPLKKKTLKKQHVPFKMHFYCEKCHNNAGSQSRPCASCGSLMRLPRPAAKSLAASKAKWDDEKAKRKLERLEALRQKAKRQLQRPNDEDA